MDNPALSGIDASLNFTPQNTYQDKTAWSGQYYIHVMEVIAGPADSTSVSGNSAATPEPASTILVGAGMIGVVALRKRLGAIR